MMTLDDYEELTMQVLDHGANKVTFIMTSDDGEGEVTITDIRFENSRIEVRLA